MLYFARVKFGIFGFEILYTSFRLICFQNFKYFWENLKFDIILKDFESNILKKFEFNIILKYF